MRSAARPPQPNGEPNIPAGPFRQAGFVDIAQHHQSQQQQHPGVGVTRAPQILPERIVGVRGVVDKQCQHADAPEHHGREHDQHDAGNSATLTGYSSHAKRRAPPGVAGKIARLLAKLRR